MVLETAQILCTAHGGPYRPTHKNHPCVKWAKDRKNAAWLLRLGLALAREYTRRFTPRTKEKAGEATPPKYHKSQAVLEQFDFNCDEAPEEFVLAMPDEYKSADPVESYRAYYLGDKARFAAWRLDGPPFWFRPAVTPRG